MKLNGYLKALVCQLLLCSFCFAADSTSVPNTQTGTTFYPDVSSVPPSISNVNYSSLPTCPTNFDLSQCPDINGTTYSGTLTSPCYDYCTVTRAPSVLSFGTNNEMTGSESEPICPPSYVMVGTYNYQNAANYNPTPPQIGPLGLTPYNAAISAGWTCTAGGPLQTSGDMCNAGYVGGQISNSVQGSGGNVVKLADSGTWTGGCWCPSSGGSCVNNCPTCPAGNTYIMNYGFYYIYCQPPGGAFAVTQGVFDSSGNYIGSTTAVAPTSYVCARAKAQWKSLN